MDGPSTHRSETCPSFSSFGLAAVPGCPAHRRFGIGLSRFSPIRGRPRLFPEGRTLSRLSIPRDWAGLAPASPFSSGPFTRKLAVCRTVLPVCLLSTPPREPFNSFAAWPFWPLGAFSYTPSGTGSGRISTSMSSKGPQQNWQDSHSVRNATANQTVTSWGSPQCWHVLLSRMDTRAPNVSVRNSCRTVLPWR